MLPSPNRSKCRLHIQNAKTATNIQNPEIPITRFVFLSRTRNINGFEKGTLLTTARLQSIFHAVMKKQIDKIDPIRSKFGKIEKEKISLGDRMQYISEYAREHKKFNFRMLLEEQTSKTMVIVSFLGILELMKEGMLKIVQSQSL